MDALNTTGDRSKFLSYEQCEGEEAKWGDNSGGKTKGRGFITLDGKSNIDDVFLMEETQPSKCWSADG